MGRQKILVVDDEADLCELVAARLETNGYEVTTARDGSEGLDMARTEHPDLIVLDIMLPRLNGYEICTMLKQNTRYQKIPIILFTAKTQASDERLGMECGADAYVRKPFRKEELLETISILLAKSQSIEGGQS